MYRMLSPNLCIAAILLALTGLSLGAEKKPAPAKKQPPAINVQIVQPAAGQELKGNVDVAVKIDPAPAAATPFRVFAGLGGPPWTELTRSADSDTWQGKLQSELVPSGTQKLTVLTSDRKARASVEVNVRNWPKVYFADLHSHTSYSDGALIPSVAHDYARNVAKLDVFCLTDHLEQVDDEEWLDMREQAFDANQDGAFVAIPGLEWTKKWGHINIYDPKIRVWPEDPAKFYQAIADAGLVGKFNHPGDGTKSHDGLAYSKVGDRAMQLMEVRRPEEEQAFVRALKLGWHIAPEGSDDTHAANWGNVRSWTGLHMPGLSKRNVLDALANRRCYSTLDRNCRLAFTVNEAPMGTIFKEPVSEVKTYVRASDGDAAERIAKIELIEDGEVIQTDEPNTQGRCWGFTVAAKPGPHFYYVRVTQADGDLAWSAPIWLTVAGQ